MAMRPIASVIVLEAILLAGVAPAQAAERSGEEVVKAQCSNCHQAGLFGAPKIDDRAAWAPRMTRGVNAAVQSAIKGHGAMPSRGGLSDLTDSELRAAILYMYDPAGASARGKAAGSPHEVRDAHSKLVDGMEIYLGVAPSPGSGHYTVNVSLRDATTKEPIKDAVVEARVSNALSGTTKKLSPTAFNQAVSYGNDFQMIDKEPYTITVNVRRPKAVRPVATKFEVRN
jgi:cytochrome c5